MCIRDRDKVEPEQIYRSTMGHYEMILELLRMDPDELKRNDRLSHEMCIRDRARSGLPRLIISHTP